LSAQRARRTSVALVAVDKMTALKCGRSSYTEYDIYLVK
jgi:hypothetical protein